MASDLSVELLQLQKKNISLKKKIKELEEKLASIYGSSSLSVFDEAITTVDNIENKPELKKIIRVMSDSLRFKEKIFEAAPIGIATYAGNGQCLTTNEVLPEIIGATKDQILSQNFLELDSWKTYGLLDLALETLNTGKINHSEVFITSTYGKSIWLDLSFSSFESAGEAHLLLMAYDISERKLNENERKESDEKYRMIFSNSSDGILLTHPDGKIFNANPAACAILGRTEAEICSLGRNGLVDNDDLEIQSALHEREKNGSVRAEIALIHKDGSKFPVEITSNIYQLPDGEKRSIIIFRDISERKRNEGLIMEALNFNQLIFETAPIGFTAYDENGKCIYTNDTFSRIIGTDKQHVLNQNFRNLASWKRANLLQQAEDALRNGGHFRREVNTVSTFGKEICVDWNFVGFKMQGVSYLLLMIYDLSDRKRIEKQLQESEETLNVLFNSAAESILLTDTYGNLITANNIVKKALFPNVENVKGLNVFEFLPPSIGRERKKIIDGVVTTKKTARFEDERSGFYFDSVISPVLDGNGNVTRVAIYSRDITEMRKAHFKLKESEELFRRIFSDGPLGMAIIDLNYKWISINQRYCDITGYSSEEIKELTFIDISYPDDLYDDLLYVEKLNNGELNHYNLDKRYVKKDNSIVWVNLTGSLIRDNHGTPLYFLAMVQDITEKKRNDELRKRNESFTKAIINSLGAHVAVLNKNGEIVVVNNSWEDFAANNGGDERVGVGVNYLQVCEKAITENDPYAVKALNGIKAVLNGRAKEFSLEYPCHSPSENRWFLLNVTPLDSENGGATLTHINITARKIAGEASLFNELLLKNVVDALPIGVFVADPKGNVIIQNEEATKIWKGTRFVGPENYKVFKGWWRDSGKRIAAEEWALLRAFRDGEMSYNEIIDIECFDGSKKVISNSAVPVYDSENKIIGAVAMLADITDKLRIEKQLSESEQKFKALIQNSADVILLVNEYGIIKYISPSIRSVLGYDPDELMGKNGFSTLYPDEVERVGKLLTELLKSRRGTISAELCLVHKNGNLVWVDAIGTNFLDEPAINAIVVNYRNISERKISEIELKKSEERFRSSIESLFIPFSIFSAIRDAKNNIVDFRYEYINEAGCRANLSKKENLIGKKLLEVLPNHENTEIFKEYCKVVNTGITFSTEAYSYEDSYNGQFLSRTFDIKAAKLGDGFAVSWEDISERENALRQLRESEANYRTLAGNLPGSAVCIFDASFQFLLAEGSELDRMGLPKKNLEGKTIYEVLPKYVCDKIEPYYVAALENKVSHFEFELPSGTYQIHVIPLEKGKQKTGMTVFHNITDMKKIEEQLLELNKNKDKFFSIISHDLRSPFTGLIGSAEMLVNDLDEMTNEQIREAGQVISQTSKRLYNLLDNLLQWSRIQTGRMEFNKEKFSISEMIESLYTIFEPLAAKKRILLAYDSSAAIEVYTDKNMISSIIQNLLSNAIKFTNYDGRIAISVHRRPEHIDICVEDNGIGMEKDLQEKLFKIEEQVSSKGTANESGSGLGLILCKEFLEKSGGRIRVETQPGIGSKFIISLPNE